MQKSADFIRSLLIFSAVLFFTGCSDRTTHNASTTSSQEVEKIPDQTIQTSNYIISIYEGSKGDSFSVRKPDQSLIASNISEAEFISDYPEAFDELILNGLSDDLEGKIYFDEIKTFR